MSDIKMVIEPIKEDCSNSTQKSLQTVVANLEELEPSSNNELLKLAADNIEIVKKILDKRNISKPEKKEDLNKQGKEGGDIDVSDTHTKKSPDATPQNDISPSESTTTTLSSADNKNNQKDELQQDRWSPLNTEGRKQYDRELLLHLKSHPLSSCKIEDVPNVIKYDVYKVYLEYHVLKKKLKAVNPPMEKETKKKHAIADTNISDQPSCGEFSLSGYTQDEPNLRKDAAISPAPSPPATTDFASIPISENLDRPFSVPGSVLSAPIPTQTSNSRNNVPQSMLNMSRFSMNATVSNPGQQPISRWGPIPFMFPLKDNSTSLPLTMMNPQFPQMGVYTPQYPIPPAQQYTRNISLQTQILKGPFISTRQQHMSSGKKTIPIIDPRTGRRVEITHDKETDKLIQSIQDVLNKLTAQKLEMSVSELKAINIDTAENLDLIVDLIYEKAIDEPKFSAPCAELCKHLALIKVAVPSPFRTQLNFRSLLLSKCRIEFELERSNALKHEEKMKTLECTEPDKRKELQLEFEEQKKKIKNRRLGNIRFIGELFKLNMFIEPIMHQCLKYLLTQGDEESLECHCLLLKMIGKELDDRKALKISKEKNKFIRNVQRILNKMTPQKFDQLSKLKALNMDTVEKLTSVVDLLYDKAIDEPNFSVPCAILCSHLASIKVPVSETSGIQVNFRKLLLNKCQKEFELDRNNKLKNEEKGKTLESTEPNKRKEIQLEYEEEEKKIRNRQLGNVRFIGELFKLNMLIEPIMHECIKKLLSQGDEESLEHLCVLLKTIGKTLLGKGQDYNREQMDLYLIEMKSIVDKQLTSPRVRFMLQDVIELIKGAFISQIPTPLPIEAAASTSVSQKKSLPSSTDNDILNAIPPNVVNPGTKPKSDISPSELTCETSSLLFSSESVQVSSAESDVNSQDRKNLESNNNPFRSRYILNNDFREAIKCVIELASPNTVHLFINAAINEVLERSSQDRHSLGQLLSSLLKKKVITFDQYKKGLAGILEKLDDYVVNVPLIFEFMGEILEPVVEDHETPFKLLIEVLQPCIPSEKAGWLISQVLHCATKWKTTAEVGDVWKQSGVRWIDIIGANSKSEFIEKHKLEFTLNPSEENRQTLMSMEEMKKHLLSLLEKNPELNEVFKWVDDNIPNSSCPTFIRALATAVHESCLSGSGITWEINADKLKSRKALISHYVSKNEKLRLEVFRAVQEFMTQLG